MNELQNLKNKLAQWESIKPKTYDEVMMVKKSKAVLRKLIKQLESKS